MTDEEIMSRCYEHGQPDYVLAGDSIKRLIAERDSLREANNTWVSLYGPAPPPQVDRGREDRAIAVLREMLKAYDAGALRMSSPEIGEPENDIPYHAWHEELLHNARLALRERSGGRET